MLDVFPYEKRMKYPHMKPADVAIWERFIESNPNAYEKVLYDVHVGSAPDFDTVVGDSADSSDINLYLKKIDVVGLKGGTIDIIELKPNAGASALGQVLGYVILYKREFAPSAEPRPVVITDVMKNDMETMAKAMGVTVLVA